MKSLRRRTRNKRMRNKRTRKYRSLRKIRGG